MPAELSPASILMSASLRPTTARCNELEAELLKDGGEVGKLLVEHFRPKPPAKPATRKKRFSDDANTQEVQRLQAEVSRLQKEQRTRDDAARVMKERLEEHLANEHAEVRRLKALLESQPTDVESRAERERRIALEEVAF